MGELSQDQVQLLPIRIYSGLREKARDVIVRGVSVFSRSNLSYFFFGTAYGFLVLPAGKITSFEFFIFWMSLSRRRAVDLC